MQGLSNKTKARGRFARKNRRRRKIRALKNERYQELSPAADSRPAQPGDWIDRGYRFLKQPPFPGSGR